jgi:serine/threonine protein kinase
MLGRIGAYEIIGLLGYGGMGAVFKGLDRSLNRFVAIKMLLTALAKAYAWQEQLELGEFEDLEAIAKANGVDRSYVGRMLQLTSLAPDIVESILAGQAFADISLRHCRKGVPASWDEQRRVRKSTAAHDLEAVANQ